MATLADSFLADMDSGDEEEDEKDEKEKESSAPGELPDENMPSAEVKELDFDAGDVDMKDAKDSVTAVANLLDDNKLQQHLQQIGALMKASEDQHGVHRNVDREAEYPVIVRSNELAAAIDNEIITVHKFARDIYATKFAELETMVQTPLDYAKTVKIIGNQTDVTLVEKELGEILPQQVILTITVTATSTIGKPLSDEDLKKVNDACDTIIRLDEYKKNIFSYIESRMAFIAPNLSAIVGAEIAARLMGTAGGLVNLSKIPACNVQVLGVKRKTVQGLSVARADLHVGIVGGCDIMGTCPGPLRLKALRLISAKVVLAARMDSFGEEPTGQGGRNMRDEIEAKIQKWQEPPPPKKKRALPVPNDKPRKRRGGKRYRKYKEKYEVTEIQKQKNRMLFGVQEKTDDFTGEGFGMLGVSGSNQVQIKAKDTQKLKNKLSKSMKARLEKQRIKTGTGTASAVAGTASSIAFTPVQGIELVNPDLQGGKKSTISDKYFSSTGGFYKAGKSGTASSLPGAGTRSSLPLALGLGGTPGSSSSSSSSSGGFAMPAPKPKPAGVKQEKMSLKKE